LSPTPFSRILASLSVCCLLLGSIGCTTAGRQIAPGISRGAAHTFTTLASDVATVTAATESAMRSRGLADVRAIASESRGEVTGTWLEHTVKATVRQAGTRTTKLVVSHRAGSLLARKLVEDVDALVYSGTFEPGSADERSASAKSPPVSTDSGAENPLAR